MKRITINLHPEGKREPPKFLKTIERFIPFIFLGLIGLILLNIAIFLFSASLRLPYMQLQRKWQELTPKVKEIEALQKSTEELRKIAGEYKKFLVHKINFAKVLAELFAALPRNIWFDNFSFDGDNLIIVGYVVRWKEGYHTSLATFIKALKKQPYFSKFFEVSLKNSKKDTVSGIEVLRFDLDANRKR